MSLLNIDISSIYYEEKLNENLDVKNQYKTLKQSLKLVKTTNKNGENNCETKKVEIIVCGPAKVGKSTLLKALTGHDVATSHSLNTYSEFATRYSFANDSVVIWDTMQFENWNRASIDNFWNNYLQSKTVVSSVCIFCVGVGAYADTKLIKYMFNQYVFRHNILLCWVVTKAGITDIDQTKTYIDEGRKLLGDVIEVFQKYTAWRTKKGFIIRLNSIKSCLTFPNHPDIVIKKFGIKTLKKIFVENISFSSQQYLIKVFKEDKFYLSYLTSFMSTNGFTLVSQNNKRVKNNFIEQKKTYTVSAGTNREASKEERVKLIQVNPTNDCYIKIEDKAVEKSGNIDCEAQKLFQNNCNKLSENTENFNIKDKIKETTDSSRQNLKSGGVDNENSKNLSLENKEDLNLEGSGRQNLKSRDVDNKNNENLSFGNNEDLNLEGKKKEINDSSKQNVKFGDVDNGNNENLSLKINEDLNLVGKEKETTGSSKQNIKSENVNKNAPESYKNSCYKPSNNNKNFNLNGKEKVTDSSRQHVKSSDTNSYAPIFQSACNCS